MLIIRCNSRKRFQYCLLIHRRGLALNVLSRLLRSRCFTPYLSWSIVRFVCNTNTRFSILKRKISFRFCLQVYTSIASKHFCIAGCGGWHLYLLCSNANHSPSVRIHHCHCYCVRHAAVFQPAGERQQVWHYRGVCVRSPMSALVVLAVCFLSVCVRPTCIMLSHSLSNATCPPYSFLFIRITWMTVEHYPSFYSHSPSSISPSDRGP